MDVSKSIEVSYADSHEMRQIQQEPTFHAVHAIHVGTEDSVEHHSFEGDECNQNSANVCQESQNNTGANMDHGQASFTSFLQKYNPEERGTLDESDESKLDQTKNLCRRCSELSCAYALRSESTQSTIANKLFSD